MASPLPVPVIVQNGSVLDAGIFASYQWLRYDTVISGAIGRYYAPDANSIYSVRATDAYGCEGTSRSFSLYNLNAGATIAADAIRLYPNPARDIVFISAPGPVGIRIYDALGRCVFHTDEARSFSVGTMSSGVYSVVMYDANGIVLPARKLIIAPR